MERPDRAATKARPSARGRRRGLGVIRGGVRAAALTLVCMLAAPPTAVALVQDDPELAALLAEERQEADRLRRRGELRAARRILTEHLSDDPDDARSRLILARCELDENRLDEALRAAERAFDRAEALDDPEVYAEAGRIQVAVHVERGLVAPADAVLARAGSALDPTADPRSAWITAQVHILAGRVDDARDALLSGTRAQDVRDWRTLLARARCERSLGWFERAANTLVEADKAANAGSGRGEADVLAELGSLYFDVYREVKHPTGNERSVGDQYEEARRLNPTHEPTLLGQFELYSYNWRRSRRDAGELLEELLASHPTSIRAHAVALSAALDDGQLVRARAHLVQLETLAPARRDVRSEAAALAWIEHRRDEADALLAELAATHPADGAPERVLGEHLCELYRFAEAVPFLRRSVEREPGDPDAWTQLARALANTGDEDGALAALYRAEEVAGGRKDAWRHNMRLVLERIRDDCVVSTTDQLSFVWRPDAAGVLSAYLPKFYAEARADLARRYGFTPDPVRIEVFRQHRDFSVRSTGFEGFPATGVCFGPVVTALSPLSEMRAGFSWARTSFHEFSHVIHLGLSHNRCPRWITEGLATWEEERRDPAWTRNMRRDLIDARANGEIIPVRDLNRAFRGPRILFGYYQGGLLCEMLIARHGFSPMVRLLEAFDRGLDLDQAFDEVFHTTPEAVDRDFLAFVDGKLADLRIEPRWNPAHVRTLRLSLSSERPESPADIAAWREDWTTLAWGSWQARQRVDAEEALRVVGEDEPGPRALFLRGEMALSRGEEERAAELWKRAIAAGGDDYNARMYLGWLAMRADDEEEALLQFRAAESAFPGFPDASHSAEKRSWELHEARGEKDAAMAVRERWLEWNSSDIGERLTVAEWHFEAERYTRAAELYGEANDVDPFRRSLHRRWATALARAERHEEALRELDVALVVPPQLDADVWKLAGGPISPEHFDEASAALTGAELGENERAEQLEALLGLSTEAVAGRTKERAEILGLKALSVFELDRAEEARVLATRALELDPENEPARRVIERLQ